MDEMLACLLQSVVFNSGSTPCLNQLYFLREAKHPKPGDTGASSCQFLPEIVKALSGKCQTDIKYVS